MNTYDFSNLSPSEFEDLVRDLLQAELFVLIESFAEGRDSGIDLRYYMGPRKQVIIQCKRFRTFPSLYSKLVTEVEKVKKHSPSKYLIATSVDLTPLQKRQIKLLFKPYIRLTGDILGRKEINNLLNKHPKVLLSHYKLYLSSVHVLKKIINSKVYNQSRFEEAEILDTIKVYVQNESFGEALSLLQKHKIVLISGHPGVGKTTLARMLVYYLLSEGFEEFAHLSDSISEAVTSYDEGKKIVFFFDDFLGTNFLDNKMPLNEDNRVLRFMSAVKRSKEHVLILATREYILNQAQQVYEKLNDRALEIAKYVLDLGKYTHVIKAQILSNHLYFHQLPGQYIRQLMENDIYLEIIYHKNFSPRIIETIIDKGEWINSTPDTFPLILKEAFDNPASVWLRIYENQISMFSKCSLAILATFSASIYLDDFEFAIMRFVEIKKDRYGILFNKFAFNASLKELQNTFITITSDDKSKLAIDFQNPSIRDFLVHYLSEKSSSSLLRDILETAVSLDQLTSNITDAKEPIDDNLPFYLDVRIRVNTETIKFIKERIVTDYESLKLLRISQYDSGGSFGFTRYYSEEDEFSKLVKLLNKTLYLNNTDTYHVLIVTKFQSLLDFDYLDFSARQSFVSLFEVLYSYVQFDATIIVSNFGKNIAYLSDWRSLVKINRIIPDGVINFKKNTELFNERYQVLIKHEKAQKKNNYLDFTIQELTSIGEELKFNVKPEVKSLRLLNASTKFSATSAFVDIEIPDYTIHIDEEQTKEEIQRQMINKIFNQLIDNLDN